MESVPQQVITGQPLVRPGRPAAGRWLAVAGLLTVLAQAAGCVLSKPVLAPEEKPVTPATQAAATWESRVVFTPDPAHNGAATPGLAGRLYLFAADSGFPVVGDGSVVVDLYDDTPLACGGQAKMIEKWCIDRDTLKRLVRKDMIGQGYTLFLPWGTYKPEINQVHLMVCYTPQKGTPLYAPSSTITLADPDGPVPQVSSRTAVPGAGAPAAAANAPPVANAGGPAVAQTAYQPAGPVAANPGPAFAPRPAAPVPPPVGNLPPAHVFNSTPPAPAPLPTVGTVTAAAAPVPAPPAPVVPSAPPQGAPAQVAAAAAGNVPRPGGNAGGPTVAQAAYQPAASAVPAFASRPADPAPVPALSDALPTVGAVTAAAPPVPAPPAQVQGAPAQTAPAPTAPYFAPRWNATAAPANAPAAGQTLQQYSSGLTVYRLPMPR
jgi:hypothetical protein